MDELALRVQCMHVAAGLSKMADRKMSVEDIVAWAEIFYNFCKGTHKVPRA